MKNYYLMINAFLKLKKRKNSYKMTSIEVADYKSGNMVFDIQVARKLKGSYMSIPTEDLYIQTPRLLLSKGIVKNETRF